MDSKSDLIHDWNSAGERFFTGRQPSFADETLRDGLQSPSIRNPSIEQKIRILHLIEALGIQSADIGLPGAGAKVAAETERLAVEVASRKMRVRPYCAARTVHWDIRPIVEISQKAGIAIEVAAFIGASPVRQYVEDWNIGAILKRSEEAIRFAVQEGLPVMFVTEDTTRTRPEGHPQALLRCDFLGRAGSGRLRYCWTCDPGRGQEPDPVLARRDRGSIGSADSDRLARSQ